MAISGSFGRCQAASLWEKGNGRKRNSALASTIDPWTVHNVVTLLCTGVELQSLDVEVGGMLVGFTWWRSWHRACARECELQLITSYRRVCCASEEKTRVDFSWFRSTQTLYPKV